MQIKIAKSLGFCFGVKRAIGIAQENRGSVTIGPLIHNNAEINRLKSDYDVDVVDDLTTVDNGQDAVIRTHGIERNNKRSLEKKGVNLIDETCPFVTKPQNIVEDMSKQGYDVIIFGDSQHPEIKGVLSYGNDRTFVVNCVEELKNLQLHQQIAIVSQTTRKPDDFANLVNYLILHYKEVRVFNTICNATFENQDAARDLAKEVDVMIVIGGKHSSNTKQLLNICLQECDDSYLVESSDDLQKEWFAGKEICGISAGASTPDWIIDNIVKKIQLIKI
ncbi:MAG: 4-hydroxy-3-methylbut-2-enyl diphosphate reductase [Campylobacterota bacterium]